MAIIEKRGPRRREIPTGDDRERLVCPECRYVAYENPKIIAGAVIEHEGRILLCRRAIEPRRGYWTIPAGYLELNETTAEGAAREAREEACAEIETLALLAIYQLPRISQVQFMYAARLTVPEIAAGPESQEVDLFAWDDIPWPDMAFPSALWALNEYRARGANADLPPATEPNGDAGILRDWPSSR